MVWRTFAQLWRSGGSGLEDNCLFVAVVIWRTFASGGSGLEDICLVLAAVVWNLEDISINVQNHYVPLPLVRFGAHLFQLFSGPLIKLG